MKFLRFGTPLISALILAGCGGNQKYVQISGYAQGGEYYVTCSISSQRQFEPLKKAINDTLSAIDWSVSGYNSGSLITRINSGERAPLDSIFIDLFEMSKRFYSESGGAVDVTCGPLFDLWGFGFRNSRMPGRQAVDSAMALVGIDRFSIETAADGQSYLNMPKGGSINFNAIAQGYSCDAVAAVLEEFGCRNYMVSLGGELVCRGVSARGGKWRVWIDRPEDGNMQPGALKQDIISVTDCGLVTSGNYRKYYIVDGRKYSHTIDPATGSPVTHDLLSATVVAEDSATADAMATAMMVLGPEKGRALAEKWMADPVMHRGVYLVYGSQDKMLTWHTPGLELESGE